MLFVCYPKCTTCKKAQKWLEQNQITYTYRDISIDNPSFEELKEWYVLSGLPIRKLVNTSGKKYREQNLKEKIPQMSDEEVLKLLSTDGMLVKRPIFVDGNCVLFGFREEDYQKIIH